MYNNIISLIGKVYDLQPIVETTETIEDRDGNTRTIKKNVLIQDYYGLKEFEGKNVSFEKALEFIEQNRKELIPQILSLTNTILEVSYSVKHRTDKETYDRLKKDYRESWTYTEKFNWCVNVLFNLGILTDAKRITYQALRDENDVVVAVKKEGESYKIQGSMILGDDDIDENVTKKDE